MRNILSFCAIAAAIACSSSTGKPLAPDHAGNNPSSSSAAGGDMYYEYRVSSTIENKKIPGSTKMFMTADGLARIEMLFGVDGIDGNSPSVLIGDARKPHQSITIDARSKTYTVNHVDTVTESSGPGESAQVMNIGVENIHGHPCVHAQVIKTSSLGKIFSGRDTIELWKSEAVPMGKIMKTSFEDYERRMGTLTADKAANDKLKEIGCHGFIVKMEMHGKRSNMVMDLIRAEPQVMPHTLFEIPAGYKEVKDQ